MKLIDKDALVAEIEGLKESNPWYPTLAEKYAFEDGLEAIKDKIYSIEVKEVDLEKEIGIFLGDNDWKEGALEDEQEDMISFAKHFFELGMAVSNKAQK